MRRGSPIPTIIMRRRAQQKETSMPDNFNTATPIAWLRDHGYSPTSNLGALVNALTAQGFAMEAAGEAAALYRRPSFDEPGWTEVVEPERTVETGHRWLRAQVPVDMSIGNMREALIAEGYPLQTAQLAAEARYGELDNQADEIARREAERLLAPSGADLQEVLEEGYDIPTSRAFGSALRILREISRASAEKSLRERRQEDPELLAMRQIARALEGLDEKAQGRVVRWTSDRFGAGGQR